MKGRMTKYHERDSYRQVPQWYHICLKILLYYILLSLFIKF